eukprot:CAMPEP_0172505642 /NCGR_PEP_ID=MMETSP1066-20121228/187982_1 /TAXON_ID=671091 /ORGANISM="Coscinodiscus wailesii, Strain CCMP2513" /LENGTH=321 /DNA_ID=CAMNT_0013282335 /DNA_START=57 /DNA_END=1022 /DNA_ORIENTATION=+
MSTYDEAAEPTETTPLTLDITPAEVKKNDDDEAVTTTFIETTSVIPALSTPDKKHDEEAGTTTVGISESKWQGQVKDGAKKAAEVTLQGAKVTADFTKMQVANAKEFIMDGPVSYRILAFAGGIATVMASIRTMVEEVFFVSPFQSIASAFNIYFGFLVILLESRAVFKRTPWRAEMYDKAAILRTTFGRGVFYFYIGINMASQNFSRFAYFVGIYDVFLGTVAIIIGYWTQRKLTDLRNALKDENMVVEMFKAVDKNANGVLDQEEFAVLCERLGVPMKKVELLAVFDLIDTSNAGQKSTITLEEFQHWWSEWDELAEVM